MDSDFNQLYAQLELRPDCSLDEFKRAYRRRVAELHPDRHPGGDARASATDAMTLSELTSLYTTATRFHRTHGRLPGAALSQRSVVGKGREAATAAPGARGEAMTPMASQEGTEGPRRTRFAALIVLLIILLIVILEARTPDRPAPAGPTAAPADRGAAPER